MNGNVKRYLTEGKKITLGAQTVHTFSTLKNQTKKPAQSVITIRKWYWHRSVVCCSPDNLTAIPRLEVVYCCSDTDGSLLQHAHVAWWSGLQRGGEREKLEQGREGARPGSHELQVL